MYQLAFTWSVSDFSSLHISTSTSALDRVCTEQAQEWNCWSGRGVMVVAPILPLPTEVYVEFFQSPLNLSESSGLASVCVQLASVADPTQAAIWLSFSSDNGSALCKNHYIYIASKTRVAIWIESFIEVLYYSFNALGVWYLVAKLCMLYSKEVLSYYH